MSAVATPNADVNREAAGLAAAATFAAVTAAALNAALYLIGVAAGTFTAFGWFPEGPGQDIVLGPILLVSVVATLAGVGTYAALRGRTARPRWTFARVVDAVLVISFVPLLLVGWPPTQALLLGLMHAVTAGTVLWAVRA